MKPACSVDACDKAAVSRGMCASHYGKWYRYGDPLAGPPARQLKPCGTWSAYQRHRTAGEEPCGPCRQAANDYHRARRKDPGLRARIKRENRVQSRAAWRLVDEHRDRFRELVAEEMKRELGIGSKP